MINDNLSVEILGYLLGTDRVVDSDELVGRFYPTPHGTVYDTLSSMVSGGDIRWCQRTEIVSVRGFRKARGNSAKDSSGSKSTITPAKEQAK